jgi:hypothetical protein
MLTAKDKTPAATGVCQCVKPCLVCKCKPTTTSPETQIIQKSVRLFPAEKKVFQDVRWRIVDLGPDADEFDTIALGYLEALLTGYSSRQEGGDNDC